MSKHFDEQLLDEFANKFYGYGDCQNDACQSSYWFIGMEEGGGNSYDEINNRLATWKCLGRHALEQIHTFHQKIGKGSFFQDPPDNQVTWSGLIQILLSASDPDGWATKTEQDQIKAAQDYQVNKLGRASGKDCLIELLPLPSKSTKTKDWIYGNYTSQPQFKTRKSYSNYYRPARIRHIQNLIHQYKPAVVVFYGRSYLPYWEQIAGASFSYDPAHDTYTLQKNTTLFVIIHHPSSWNFHRGFSRQWHSNSVYSHKVGQVIASLRQK